MKPYPENDKEFGQMFQTEADCLEYLIKLRWPDGPLCPTCKHDKLWRNDNGLVLECAACGHKLRPLVGTVFQDTHVPFGRWLEMMWYIMSQKYGANATGLAKVLDLAYTTASNILHKLRRTMVRAEREKLGPVVEVDESYIGGPAAGKPGRRADKKTLVAVAVELSEDQMKMGRIRLAVIPDDSSESLITFIKKNVEEGSLVLTDGWSSYLPLKHEPFRHEVKTIEAGEELLPHVRLVFSLVKRWILGTFKGSISPHKLGYYLDEYVFRFNCGESNSRGKLFRRLMEQAVATPPVTRKEL
jgi:transposase-like protein/Zn ribbon nucleic-acid-binding protein